MKGKVIDIHAHFGKNGTYPWLTSNINDFKELNKRFDAKFIIMTSNLVHGNDYKKDNKNIINLVKNNKNIFLGCYLLINPLKNNLNEIKRLLTKEVVGLKIVPSYVEKWRNNQVGKFIELAYDNNLTVMFHCGWDYRPDNIEHFKDYKTKIIIGHFGGISYRSMLSSIEISKKIKNVFIETGIAQIMKGILEKSINSKIEDKLMFGTDFPIFDFKILCNSILINNLTKIQKEKILIKNAQKVFNLVDE